MSNFFNIPLVAGLQACPYISETNHYLLHADAWKGSQAATGINGSNLTISFLSLNRSNLTVRLLNSISKHLPLFEGEVLIIDNGSEKAELESITQAASSMTFRCRIIELGRNYGVGGARNRTIEHVTTDWLMNLDNDIYFIDNPLESIQKHITTIGCHFLSLPLLNPDLETVFAFGGHLYVTHSNGQLFIGAGSACVGRSNLVSGNMNILSTFLFGGSCVVNVKTFSALGGYDDNMFIGFEDLDFSIRLFQQGFKVGSLGTLALVHDHPKPTSNADTDYEKKRFSREVLKQSAAYMSRKHGFGVWSDAVENWLEAKNRELCIEEDEKNHSRLVEIKRKKSEINSSAKISPQDVNKKPNIALILDTDNWAFGNIARQILKHCSDQFDFKVIPMDIIDNIDQVFLMAEECQLVHFFWREHVTLIGTPYYKSYAEIMSGTYQLFHERFIASKIISTSIYDHLLLDQNDLDSRQHLYKSTISGYTVASEKLNQIYTNVPGYPPPKSVITDGVDLSIFEPKNIERFQSVGERDLVVGWVGNSKWASELEDFKGLNTIIKPALIRLKSQGCKIKAHFADRQDRFIPHEKMSAYYNEIDVLVCASKIEGTPNPVLEAMACGVPVISTDVGIVSEALGPLQKSYIMNTRSMECFEQAIKKILANPLQIIDLSKENISQIAAWKWEIKAKQFGKYFKKLLDSRDN
jgi:glycosyltransferase involved in cell wall biosynthesis/GT2 family glycosyltransferase